MPAVTRRLPAGPSLWQRIWSARRPLCALLLGAALTVGVATGTLGRLAKELADGALLATAEAGFGIARITLSGRNLTPLAEIQALLPAASGQPMLALDPAALRRDLEAIGWVGAARVTRRWPDRLDIALVERRPVALWQHEGRLALVDRSGAVLTRQELGRWAALPIVVGANRREADAEAAPPPFAAVLDAVRARTEIAAHIRALVWVGQRRWDLRLENGATIRLPEGDPSSALDRLAALQRELAVIDRPLRAVDLRVPDRLLVEPLQPVPPAPESAENRSI